MATNKAVEVKPFHTAYVKAAPQPACSCSGKVPYNPEASEPSLFTNTHGQVSLIWTNWFSKKFGLTEQMAFNVGTALYVHMGKEEGRPLPEYGPASIYVSGTDLISMEFVVDAARRYGLSFVDGVRMAESLRKVDVDRCGLTYSIGDVTVTQAFTDQASFGINPRH